MTRQEFDAAFDWLRNKHNKIDPRHGVSVTVADVAAACCVLMRRRLGFPITWKGPTRDELIEYLDSMDRRQREILKEVAEDYYKDPADRAWGESPKRLLS